MADDELSVPLGRTMKAKRPRFRLPIRLSHVVAGALGVFVLTAVGWAVLVDDPHGGEPVALIRTAAEPPKRAVMPSVAANEPIQGPRSYSGPETPQAPATPAVAPAPPPPGPAKTVTIIDGSTGQRQEVAISGNRDVRAPVEQRLAEVTRHGAVPRIAPDGARPADVYARPVVPAPGKKPGPQVAIVVTGLGVGAAVTQQAISKLPAPITLAFSPYGSAAERQTTEARAAGHELLLQAPMEPFDYPDNDPGPQTLLTTLTAEQNIDRLHWLMSRFPGYVGVINAMGARFTSTESALAPMLKETARRGLIYMDDGASPRSLAGQIASANNLPFVKSEMELDAVPNAAHIDRALGRLEAAARERGSAVGIAHALPVSIERIAAWAKAAEGRGITLVPISAAALKPKSS